jgi:GDP-D-mannose dehydratase
MPGTPNLEPDPRQNGHTPNIMWHSEQDDFVLATGEEHSGRQFVERAFAGVGKRLVWRG